MTLYRQFRGKDPDRTPLLKARGLYEEPQVESEEELRDDGLLSELRRVSARAAEEDARDAEQLAAEEAQQTSDETNKK